MLEQYRQIITQNHWQEESSTLSASQKEWLLHQGSLTQKLLAVSSHFNVECCSQKWIANKLQNSTAYYSEYLLREVFLKEGTQAWIFAQTYIPQETVENVAMEVLSLGKRPIGLWLFPQNPVRTSLKWQQDPHSGLYSRQSCYLLHQYPLEIRELFLPTFPFLK